MDYDILLIHPPAIYDFRKLPIFPGVLGSTVASIQFSKVPIGLLSIADYLDRHGYKVMVDNISDRMINNANFDVEEHIKNRSAKVYGIDLHWHHHAQGAMEIARLCKELHPNSLVVLGGLTATYFHEEIIQKYKFVDAVIRGEGEKAFLEFIRALEKYGRIIGTSNLTYRSDEGEIRIIPLMKPSINLDEFDFLRFDLLEPKMSILTSGPIPHWSLVVCRGCMYNCATCGGSAYTYKKYLGMNKPSFRSPEKIVADMRKLDENGIHRIGLYQDPRMGGEAYWKKLMDLIRNENLNLEMLSVDILSPASEEFIKEIATIKKQVTLYICPDSGNCNVRKTQGRQYSNEDLLNTIKICHRYHIPVTTFFSVGLAGESDNTIIETYDLWDKLCTLDKIALNQGKFGNVYQQYPLAGPIMGPIFIDPGSLAFDYPDKYGYKLSFKDLEEYIKALCKPSWHQWLNHETNQLCRDDLINLIFESVEYSIFQRNNYGIYEDFKYKKELFRLRNDRIIVNEVNRIMELEDKEERESNLKSLKDTMNSFI